MKRMDWRRAKLGGKRSVSAVDEQEFRDRDAASRWLKRIESWKPPRHSPKSGKGRS